MTSKSNRGAIKTVGIMMIISLFGKILGLFRDILYGSNFGTATIESQAFAVAGSIPRNFLDAVFASVITASFIPIFNEVYETKGKEQAEELSSSFITLIFISSAVIALLLVIFSANLTNLFGGGFNPAAKELTTSLLRIMFPLIIFSGIAFCFTGILQCMGEFNIPAAMSVVSNIIIIIYYLFYVDKYGIKGVAWVFLIGWASQAVIQIPFLIKHGYKFRLRLDFQNAHLKKILRLMLPVMVSTWAMPVNFSVNTALSTYAGEGGSSALYFSNSLFTIITGVFVLSVSNMVFPEFSRLSLDNDKRKFASSLNATLRSVTFLLIPMTAGLIVLSEPIIRLTFERGLFDINSTALTKTALIFYSIGIPGYGFQTILSRGFYALKDGKTPLLTAVLAIAVNLAVSFLLLKPMGIGGLALASSVSITIVGLVMLIVMSKRHGSIIDGDFIGDAAKMAATAFCMAVIVYLVKEMIVFFAGSSFYITAGATLVGVLAGIFFYMFMCRLLHIKEANVFFDFLKKYKGV